MIDIIFNTGRLYPTMDYVTATAFGNRTTGVILSGMDNDGQERLREIYRNHRFAVVQAPRSCQYTEMASSIIANLDNSNVPGTMN